MSAIDDRDFHNRLRRVDSLVQTLEAGPDPATREAARELVRALLDLHAAGLAKMIELAGQESTQGRALADRFAADALVANLLLLHGLHPDVVERRVARALDRLQSRLRASGGAVELVTATPEVIHLRLRGDPASGPLLRLALEEALVEAAPDVTSVEIEEAWDHPALGRVPLQLVGEHGSP